MWKVLEWQGEIFETSRPMTFFNTGDEMIGTTI